MHNVNDPTQHGIAPEGKPEHLDCDECFEPIYGEEAISENGQELCPICFADKHFLTYTGTNEAGKHTFELNK